MKFKPQRCRRCLLQGSCIQAPPSPVPLLETVCDFQWLKYNSSLLRCHRWFLWKSLGWHSVKKERFKIRWTIPVPATKLLKALPRLIQDLTTVCAEFESGPQELSWLSVSFSLIPMHLFQNIRFYLWSNLIRARLLSALETFFPTTHS